MRRRKIALLALALLAVPLAAANCNPDPQKPAIFDPPQNAVLSTEEVYVAVRVLTAQGPDNFKVFLEENGGPAVDVTSQFSLLGTFDATRQVWHANLPVSVGSHVVFAVQEFTSGDPDKVSADRAFQRSAGPIVELPPLDSSASTISAQAAKGAIDLGTETWILMGETEEDDAPNPPIFHTATQAASSDSMPEDGIGLTYFDEPSPGIVDVLPLAPLVTNDEEQVWLSAPFEDGADVRVFYVRIDDDATPAFQGVGIAEAIGGALPFQRRSYPTGGHFGDAFSLFDGQSFPLVRGALVDEGDLYLYGQAQGPSLPEDRPIVLVRVPAAGSGPSNFEIDTPTVYEYWAQTGDMRSWQTSPGGLPAGAVPLFKNATAPSVAWNGHILRWLAISTLEQGTLTPYSVAGPRSAIELRVADDLRGPWSPPVPVVAKPMDTVGALGEGTVIDAMHLPGFDQGNLIYITATNRQTPTGNPAVELYQVDLDGLGIDAGPVPPEITTSGVLTDNPATIAGYATRGDTVALFVDGVEQESTNTADASTGRFEISAILNDGANVLHAQASNGGLTSASSVAVTVQYDNQVNRTIPPGTILTGTTVWTAGDGTPYAIQGALTVASSALLVIQDGVVLEVAAGATLTVDGELRIQGAPGNRVRLAPPGVTDPANCTPGAWQGIALSGSATIVESDIWCAIDGLVTPIGASANLVIEDSSVVASRDRGIRVQLGGHVDAFGVVIDGFSIAGIQIQSATGSLDALAIVGNAPGGGGGTGVLLSFADEVSIMNSTIENSQFGISFSSSSPTSVDGNDIFGNATGVEILTSSAPMISANQIHDNLLHGVRVTGTASAAQYPAPVVANNNIFANGTNFRSQGFNDPSVVDPELDAGGNWWGSASGAVIAGTIEDASDDGSGFVGFIPFLNAPFDMGGFPVGGNFLFGPVTGTLTAEEPYEVVGDLIVEVDAPLTIEAGAELRFADDVGIIAKDVLTAAGTALDPILFRSALASPASGVWDGIRIEGGDAQGSLVAHALISHANEGVAIIDSWGTVSDSVIANFGRANEIGAGVVIDGEDPVWNPGEFPLPPRNQVLRTTFRHTLEHSQEEVYGIRVVQSAPLIEENDVQDADTGIRIEGSQAAQAIDVVPTVSKNTIQNNQDGVYVTGHAAPEVIGDNLISSNTRYGVFAQGQFQINPSPAVRENQIHGNGTHDAHATGFANPQTTVLDFEHNWWGTPDLVQIAAQVHDQSDSSLSPIIDYAPPLDGPAGAPVPGVFLTGTTESGQVLESDDVPHQVVGLVTIPAGQTLQVQGGARVEFLPGAALRAEGDLLVQGTSGELAVFTADRGSGCSPGDWEGILIAPTSTGTVVDYAHIECAERAIEIQADGVTVSNSEIGAFSAFIGLADSSGIYLNGGSSGTIVGNTIDNAGGGGIGIELHVGTATIEGNTILGARRGIKLTTASPLITGNTIQGHTQEGILVGISSNPIITENVIGGAVAGEKNGTYGIAVVGDNVEIRNPAPVIHGNDLIDNQQFDLYANSFGSPGSYTLDATLNYWGADSGIDGLIHDATDAPGSAPVVDFDPWQLQNGSASTGNYLNGTLSSDLTLLAGETWDVLGSVTVPVTRTLTVQENVTLRFAAGTSLSVQGTLEVAGTASQKAVFTSAETAPPEATWEGIYIESGTSTISHARIQYAHHGIDARNATVDVADSEVLDFGRVNGLGEGAGLYYENASGVLARNTVQNTLDHSAYVTHGIHLVGEGAGGLTLDENTVEGADNGITIFGGAGGVKSTPELTRNTVQSNVVRGIWVKANTDPTIGGLPAGAATANLVTGNLVGIQAEGDPQNSARDSEPVIHGNDIFGNGTDLQATSYGNPDGAAISAESNWWGTATTQSIADQIFDGSDPGGTGRVVDFAPYLDDSVGNGGLEVAGVNFLTGAIAGGTTLAAGDPYEATGDLLIGIGDTVTVGAGAELRFVAGGRLRVAGQLLIQGAPASPAILTSIAASGPGDWEGIAIEPTSMSSLIANAEIRFAKTAVKVDGTSVTISDSDLISFSDYGVRMSQAGGTLDGNFIENGSDLGTGVWLEESSPTLTANTIQNNKIGLHIRFGSDPIVGGLPPSVATANIITDNETGILLEGGHIHGQLDEANPNPTINGNDIFGNGPLGGLLNFHVKDFFFDGIDQVLDLRQNWWGDTTASAILAGFQLDDVPPMPVDFSNFLDDRVQNGGTSTGTTGVTNAIKNVTHDVGSLRTVAGEEVMISFDLVAPATVDLEIYCIDETTACQAQQLVHQDTLGALPIGTGYQFTWDGKSGGSFQPDGAYRYVLKADGGVAGSYDPPALNPLPPVGFVTSPNPGPSSFNAFRNEPWVRDFTVTDATRRVALRVRPEGQQAFLVFDKKPYAPGTHTAFWDGRDENGLPVSGKVFFDLMDLNSNLEPNHIVIFDVAPNVTGVNELGPSIEVHANPALLYHSYDQISTITYSIDQDATVAVRLLPPGVTDSGDPSVEEIEPSQLRLAGQHTTAPWTGYDAADENRVLVSEEGAYTFEIEATSQLTGATTKYRGVLQLRR